MQGEGAHGHGKPWNISLFVQRGKTLGKMVLEGCFDGKFNMPKVG